MDSSSSGDEGSVYDNTAYFDSPQGSDEEEHGLADAFQQFEAQAEKRTLELLKATDEQLFQLVKGDSEPSGGQEEGSFPAYIYMSYQFRLKKPPQLQHWQQNFQYLQVTGSSLLDGERLEHIQIEPTEVKDDGVGGKIGETLLQVEGKMCLQNSTCESKRVYEEIITCDGEMEETLEHHEISGDEMNEESEHGQFSPQTAHMEEVLDVLTMECFSVTVAPVLTSFYKSMLEKQQHSVRTAREEREAVANRTVEEQTAFEKARQLRLEQEAQEEETRIETLEKERQEEERKEVERRELLLKQQLEENDEDEVKIKTLAYSHTREWYQPNKKCFSHRGRQLTYLKPVLQAKESDEVLIPDTQECSPPRTRQSNVLKKSRSGLQRPQPEWVTGGALTNDKLCDISWVKKIARPPVNPPPSPLRNGSRRRRNSGNQTYDATSSGSVHLPTIASSRAQPKNKVKAMPSAPTRKRTASPIPAQTSAPPMRSPSPLPYQVPPRIIAEGNHNKDRQHHSANAAH